MTREEEIRKASNGYINTLELSKRDFEYCDIEDAFEAGAQWADTNSKFPWISVEEDLPCNHKELIENEHYTKNVLVVLEWVNDPSKKHIETAYMCNKIGSFVVNWYWDNRAHYHVTHWTPMPKMPKE